MGVEQSLPCVKGAQTVEKVHCRGAQCAPVPICHMRNFPEKSVAAPGWRANNVRPYILYMAKLAFFDTLGSLV